jgi:hypothetical protein
MIFLYINVLVKASRRGKKDVNGTQTELDRTTRIRSKSMAGTKKREGKNLTPPESQPSFNTNFCTTPNQTHFWAKHFLFQNGL